ncbi:MAG: VanZ family protein [Syntrophobacteraceae bacterium]
MSQVDWVSGNGGFCPDLRPVYLLAFKPCLPDAQPIFSTKVFHPIEYLDLSAFISLAPLPALLEKGLLAFSIRVFLLGVLLAASDEFHQAFVPGRTPRLTDIVFGT